MRAVEKRLRARITDLVEELETVKKDREKFRNACVCELKRQLTTLGESKYWKPEAIIERFVQFMQTVERWYW